MKSKLAAVVLFALVAAACGQSDDGSSQTTVTEPSTTSTTTTTAVETTTTATPPTTLAASEPSQSAADAQRDGVVAALAALPVSVRVVPEVTVPTDEGLWVLSRPGSDAMNLTQGCGLGDPTGLYGRDLICVGEYGEVLLMDAAGEQILRAYPLPALPPNSLVVTDDAVYCGRYGDGALPDSMICRIDRTTLNWIVRVFPWENDSALAGLYVPDNWTIDEPIDAAYVETMQITKDGLVVEGWGGEKLVDPLTLQLGDTP